MTTELTGSSPADSPHDGGLAGRSPGVHQLTDAEWRDLKEYEDAQRTYPALADDGYLDPWQPPADLPAGTSWLGVTEDGQPLLVRTWVCDGERHDGPALVPHVWVIGRTGSGKSATVRALLGPDLAARREVLLPLDGTGAMSPALAGFALTRAIAQTIAAAVAGSALLTWAQSSTSRVTIGSVGLGRRHGLAVSSRS